MRSAFAWMALLASGCGSEPESAPSVPRDALLRARDLKAGGSRNTFSLATLPGVGTCWLSDREIELRFARDNYVEGEFTAVSGTAYRCWAYLGGCCQETFEVLLQTTDGTVLDRDKRVSMEPGGNIADLIKIEPVGLAIDHQAHGGEKRPAVWMWVSIPLPGYATGGSKRIRLLTCQKGCAVAAVKVSSLDLQPPESPPPPE
ncbi:MAG TPA: hypothetical protein VJB14_00645 [Planctomycetota bacterium]|nr:hypothetical protein [Planctomycetota bacterium]